MHKEAYCILRKQRAINAKSMGRIRGIIDNAGISISKTAVDVAYFNFGIGVCHFGFRKSTRYAQVDKLFHLRFYTEISGPIPFHRLEADTGIRIVQTGSKTNADTCDDIFEGWRRWGQHKSCAELLNVLVRMIALQFAVFI